MSFSDFFSQTWRLIKLNFKVLFILLCVFDWCFVTGCMHFSHFFYISVYRFLFISLNGLKFKKTTIALNCSPIVNIIIAICVFCCHSFQKKVEMFHEDHVSAFGENKDGYIAKTIALANCCPPFRYIDTSSNSREIICCLFRLIECHYYVHYVFEQELCRTMCTQRSCCQRRLWPQSQSSPGQDCKPECESAEW